MASMAHSRSRPPKTVEDYLTLPDDIRAELIRGVLYVKPASSPAHHGVVLQLARHLPTYADQTGAWRMLMAPVDVHLPTGDVVQPDVLFVHQRHADRIGPRGLGVPDLVAEAASPSNAERDRFVKRSLYAIGSVQGY